MNQENFKLKKIKLNKKGGFDLEFKTTQISGEQSFESEVKRSEETPPHPDATKLMAECLPILKSVFEYPEENERVNVTGLKFTGKDKTAGVVLSGTLKTAGGQKVALNTPNLRYNVTAYGYEERLQELENELSDEAFGYLFAGKKAQIEIDLD